MKSVLDVTRMAMGRLCDLFAPALCAACDEQRVEAGAFCSRCSEALAAPQINQAVLGVPLVAAYTYTTPIKRAILRLKYEARPDLAHPLGRLLVARLPAPLLTTRTLLVPVPLHAKRLVERGYNQAALLAREPAFAKGAPLDTRALKRIRNTEQQVGHALEERWRNVANAFQVCRPRNVRDRVVVLVDDVVTTGATASACIAVLRAAGAEVAAIVAVARAEKPAPAP